MPACSGRRVLVTRGTTQLARLSDGLRRLGAVPVEVPVIEIMPPVDLAPCAAALRHLEVYDWILLTSTNTVRMLFDQARSLGIALRPRARIAAIGAATAAAAREAGLEVSLVPDAYVAERLVETLREKAAGKRVLLARAAMARDLIPDSLRGAGATVDVVEVYRNAVPRHAPEQLRRAWREGLDAATFTSSSSVTHLATAAREAELPFPLPRIAAISIGPITSRTLRESGWPPSVEADPHDIAGLLAAVERHFSSLSGIG